MKLAAIDIGSNAIRLLICSVQELEEEVLFNKELLVRAPIRLGEQSFLDGKIHENKIQLLSKALSAFRNLMEIYQVDHYKAIATSAMRMAENHPSIVDRIKNETAVFIDVIQGKKEAKTIHQALKGVLAKKNASTFLSIDVGGGSTEMVLFHNKEVVAHESFEIGTIRVLNYLVPDEEWKAMQTWLEGLRNEYPEPIGLGSGGNIIKIHKLYLSNQSEPLTRQALDAIKMHLESFSLRDRIKQLGLKPDRADVIVPASEIFSKVMDWSGMQKILVPKIGLSDGIIRDVYEDYKIVLEGKEKS